VTKSYQKIYYSACRSILKEVSGRKILYFLNKEKKISERREIKNGHNPMNKSKNGSK
jgi:hypothetical protein